MINKFSFYKIFNCIYWKYLLYSKWSGILYCAPVEFAVQLDCRPPARYFPGGITVNPGGLQYKKKNVNDERKTASGGFEYK